MTTPELRINARLTDDDARHFRELQQREGLSASELLRRALREYHVARVRPRANAAALLAAAGFIGAGDGPADLSSRYKDYLSEAWTANCRVASRMANRRASVTSVPIWSEHSS